MCKNDYLRFKIPIYSKHTNDEIRHCEIVKKIMNKHVITGYKLFKVERHSVYYSTSSKNFEFSYSFYQIIKVRLKLIE